MLGDVLHSCVHAGASVSFILPFSPADARSFWSEKILPTVYAGTCRVLVARRAGRIVQDGGLMSMELGTIPEVVALSSSHLLGDLDSGRPDVADHLPDLIPAGTARG